ncbi:hypothetical protein [Piscirickettsia salmonis]|uniref:hypothetical protein n=1 Tax=Piscirickettsia salmonis TaxID=1238 RepID=UPI0007C904F4|nr:hypothetical protein A0O36_00857 [Piscirickettsiaceae bacterium NZ-RLO1]
MNLHEKKIELVGVDKEFVNKTPIFILVKIPNPISKNTLKKSILNVIPNRFSSKIEKSNEKLKFNYIENFFHINQIYLKDNSILNKENISNLPISFLRKLGPESKGLTPNYLFSASLISTKNQQYLGISLSHAAGDGYSLVSFTNQLLKEISKTKIVHHSNLSTLNSNDHNFDEIIDTSKQKLDTYYNKLLIPNDTLAYLNNLNQNHPSISLQSIRTAYLIMKIGPYIGHAPNHCTLRIPIDLRKFCQKKDKKYQWAIGNYFTDAVIELPKDYNQHSVIGLAKKISRAIKQEIKNIFNNYTLENEFTSIKIDQTANKKSFNSYTDVSATSIVVPNNYILGLATASLALLDTISENSKNFIEVISSKPLPNHTILSEFISDTDFKLPDAI